MTRRRSVWIAVAAAVVLLGAYLARRRRRTAPAMTASPAPPRPASARSTPAPATTSTEAPSTAEGHVFFDDGATGAEPRGDDDGKPLPTWVRATVVVAALLAFFAVSLIATRQL